MTLIANRLTLVEMPRLLTDVAFRQQLLEQVTDPELVAFWRERYEKWGRDTPVMIESVLNKVTAFTFNPQLRLILGATENRLNFRQIMDEGKVLSGGPRPLRRGDEKRYWAVSSLPGWNRPPGRERIRQGSREPFYFCIDEFQDFCANDGGPDTGPDSV
jgi:hypothetical protein